MFVTYHYFNSFSKMAEKQYYYTVVVAAFHTVVDLAVVAIHSFSHNNESVKCLLAITTLRGMFMFKKE